MGKLRCALPMISTYSSFCDPVLQLDYATLLHSEEAFTVFADACAQAGAAKCLPVSAIQGNATGSDIRTLITSTIDVGRLTQASVSCEEAYTYQ
jgi:hypothetical protein